MGTLDKHCTGHKIDDVFKSNALVDIRACNKPVVKVIKWITNDYRPALVLISSQFVVLLTEFRLFSFDKQNEDDDWGKLL